MNYIICETPEEIVKKIFLKIQMAIVTREHINIALLGGSTIHYIVDYLNTHTDVDLGNITFFMGDERLVPFEDSENNTHNFLKNLKIPVNMVKIDTSLEKKEMKESYICDLKKHNAFSSFHCMILGVGEDGHTLSVFPKNLYADLQTDEIVDFYTRESDNQMRLGFTLPFAMKAKNLFFIAVGDSKSSIVKEIIQNNNEDIPVGAVLHNNSNAVLFLDTKSAKDLSTSL